MSAPPSTPIALRQLPLLARAHDGAQPLLTVTLPSATPRARGGLSLAVRLPGAARFELVPFETAQGELRFTVPPRTRGRVVARVLGLERAPRATVATEVGDDADARRTLLIVASAHTDLGYTALQEKVAEAHAENIAAGLALNGAYPAFVWNLECLWQLEVLRELHGEKAFRLAIDALRERRLGASALYLLMLPGMLSRPMLARYVDTARVLRRKFRLPLRAATLTDVPTSVPSWPSLLREAGVRWLIHGVNNYGAMPWRPDELAGRPGPVRWVAPDGQSVVVQYARWPQDRPAFGPGYAQLQALGLAGDGVVNLRVPDAVRAVELFLRDHSAAPRGLPLLVHGAYFENARLTERLPQTVAAFRAKYAAPEIRFTTAEGFFEEALGDDLDGRALPIVRGGGGAYWESGIASTARETGWFRAAMHECETLESLAPRAAAPRIIATVVRPLVLFGEHTWGAAESVTKPDSESSRTQLRWKMQRLAQARRALAGETRELARAAVNRSNRSKRSTQGRTLVLFRSERTAASQAGDLFECTVPRGTTPAGEDGRPLAAALLARFAGHERLLVRAEVGLARGANCFALVDAPAPRAATVVVDRATQGRFARPLRVSSSPLALTVDDDGRIALFEAESGAPLTDLASFFGFGDWIHAAGGDRSRLVHTEWIDGAMTFYEEEPRLTVARPAWRTRRVTLTPLGPRVELAGSAPFTPRVQLALQLHSGLPRVDLELFVVRAANRAKEAAYVALPFALKRPRLVYDAAGTPCDFERDLLPGAARDWIAVGRWLRLDGRAASSTRTRRSTSVTGSVTIVPREAALFTVGDLFRGEWAARRAPSGSLFAYVMNNYWPTNYAAEQRGPARFRFTIHFAAGSSARPALHEGSSTPLSAVVDARR